jgi:hypothetical protein
MGLIKNKPIISDKITVTIKVRHSRLVLYENRALVLILSMTAQARASKGESLAS